MNAGEFSDFYSGILFAFFSMSVKKYIQKKNYTKTIKYTPVFK